MTVSAIEAFNKFGQRFPVKRSRELIQADLDSATRKDQKRNLLDRSVGYIAAAAGTQTTSAKS